MLDSLFMPARTFTLLVAATAAFAAEFSAGFRGSASQPRAVVTLERVVVTAPKTASTLARVEHAEQATETR